jgi:hypothetical protein
MLLAKVPVEVLTAMSGWLQCCLLDGHLGKGCAETPQWSRELEPDLLSCSSWCECRPVQDEMQKPASPCNVPPVSAGALNTRRTTDPKEVGTTIAQQLSVSGSLRLLKMSCTGIRHCALMLVSTDKMELLAF